MTDAYEYVIERAEQQFDAAKAKLLRQEDGQPIFGPEEHAARLEALVQSLNVSLSAPVAASEKTAVQAEAEAELAAREPFDRLSPGLGILDRDALGRLQPFIREDVNDLPLGQAADRVTAAAKTGDTPSKILYSRYGRRRLEREIQGLRRPMTELGDNPGTAARHPDPAGLSALRAAVEALDSALADPQAETKRQGAREARRAAVQVAYRADAVLARADGRAATAADRMRDFVKSSF